MVSAFLLLPLAYLGTIVYALATRRRRGIGISLALFGGAVMAGLWAISRSRSSTAGIGLLFLPLYGSAAGASAWGFALLRSRPRTAERLAGWVALGFSLFLIAAQLRSGVSENQAYAHISPLSYLRKIRAATARELLGEPGASVEQVAELVGFSSAEQLRRAFRRFEQARPIDVRLAGSGVSPGASIAAGSEPHGAALRRAGASSPLRAHPR